MVELHRDHGMGLCVHCYNYLKRKKFKTLMQKEQYGSDEYKKYNNTQYSIKVIANGLYGNLGYPKFRIYKRGISNGVRNK